MFPLGLRIRGRLCLVVGDGEEALRRADALGAAGATVRVVSSRPSSGLRERAGRGEMALTERAFEDADLDDVWLAVLADPDSALAERMDRAAEQRRVFYCAVDQPAFGTFSHAAIVRAGPVTVAISTDGKAPSLARRLREELERLFEEADLGKFAERLFQLREATPSTNRRAVLAAAVGDVRFTGALALPDRKA